MSGRQRKKKEKTGRTSAVIETQSETAAERSKSVVKRENKISEIRTLNGYSGLLGICIISHTAFGPCLFPSPHLKCAASSVSRPDSLGQSQKKGFPSTVAQEPPAAERIAKLSKCAVGRRTSGGYHSGVGELQIGNRGRGSKQSGEMAGRGSTRPIRRYTSLVVGPAA